MGPPQEGEAGPLPGAGNEVRKHFKAAPFPLTLGPHSSPALGYREER